jgi:hypothetical protein
MKLFELKLYINHNIPPLLEQSAKVSPIYNNVLIIGDLMATLRHGG